ncbi:MAG: hypothetical protein QOG63_6 [Thermoleophilaceae bacterium]|nr:hypothetical protein [Thermoleophilaceae bacterium]
MGALLNPQEGDVRKLKLIAAAVVAAFAMLAIPGAAMAKDRDHDKMPDRWERAHGLSVHKQNAKADPDKDGLSNRGEFRSGTDPRDPDSDNDGTEDGDEDGDGDNVDNANEIREHTNPEDRDSNNDGQSDGSEDRDHDGLNNSGEDDTANDPVDPDSDNDGTQDGDEIAGTVKSFDAATGVLVITGLDNQDQTGAVTDATEIKCETEDENEDGENHRGRDHGVSAADHGSDDNGGDSSGPGSGDDQGGDNSGPGSDGEHDGDADNVCTTADLTAGTVVHEADLTSTPDGPVWDEIDLVK